MDNSRKTAWWMIPLFAMLYPLLTGRTYRDANEVAFHGLMAAGALAAVPLLMAVRGWPMERSGRLIGVCAGLATAYGVGLLVATFGPRIDILLMAVTWAGVVIALSRWRAIEAACGREVALWLLAYVLWILAVCLLTTNQHVALAGNFYRRTGLAAFGACLSVFLATAFYCRGALSRRILLAAIVAGSTATALVALGQFFLEGGGWAGWFRDLRVDPRPMGTMGHPNWLGTGLCLGLPLALAAYFGGRTAAPNSPAAGDGGPPDRSRSRVWLTAVLIQFAGLLVCQTRGAWLAAFAGVAIVLWIERRQSMRRNILLAGLLAVAAVLLPWRDGEIAKRMMSLGNEVDLAMVGHDVAGTGRFGFWKYALQQMPGTLLRGTGLDAFDLAGPDAPVDKAHSIYFEAAVTTGLPGLVLMLGFFAACFWRKNPTAACGSGMAWWGFRVVWVIYLLQGIFIHDVIHVWPLLWITAAAACLRESSTIS